MQYTTKPYQPLRGSISVPADKSITHRALIFNSLAQHEALIDNPLLAKDTLATINALRNLGVKIQINPQNSQILLKSKSFTQPLTAVNCGNSGTTARLLCGLLARSPLRVTLTGDDSLRNRPIQRVAYPLSLMGVYFDNQTTLPMTIAGTVNLKPINYHLSVASAQVKTALLLAALQASGTSYIHLTGACRDHSERLFELMGVELQVEQKTIKINGPQTIHSQSMVVPGDFSAAAFWIIAATLVPDSELLIKGVGVNPSRTGLLTVLNAMGADISFTNQRIVSNEPIADLIVKSANLIATEVTEELIANLQDEIPILLIAAAFAKGTTVIHGISELRVKESDRVTAMQQGLIACGIAVEVILDTIKVTGNLIQPANIKSFSDHRIAMAFIIAGGCSGVPMTVDNVNCIDVSYPNFLKATQRWHKMVSFPL